MGLETVEAVGPVGVGASEPVVHWEQAVELKPRGAALAVASPTNEAGALEHFQVLGDRRLGQGGGLCELDDPGLARREALQDRPASGIGKCGESEAQGVTTRHCY